MGEPAEGLPLDIIIPNGETPTLLRCMPRRQRDILQVDGTSRYACRAVLPTQWPVSRRQQSLVVVGVMYGCAHSSCMVS